MRQPRLKIDSDLKEAVYHCIDRIVGGQHLLNRRAKEKFRQMMWDVADFCGVQILTYVVMSNHPHIFVLVPKRTPITDQELLRRFAVLHHPKSRYHNCTTEDIRQILEENGPEAAVFRARMWRLMNDLSCFMQLLKERFCIWYNAEHDRFGTLWAGRFKSPLNEKSVELLTVIGAYIDLNSVRAGLAVDPKDYPYCGYAEAIAGHDRAQKGIMILTGCDTWEEASRKYRQMVFRIGNKPKLNAARISDERYDEVMRKGGKLTLEELLECKVKYFTDSLILGSAEFVAEHMGMSTRYLMNPRIVHPIPCEVGGVQLAVPQRMRGRLIV